VTVPNNNLIRIIGAAWLVLAAIGLGLMTAALLSFAPQDLMLGGQICVWLGLALRAGSWPEFGKRAFGILLVVPVVVAGAIILWAFQALASPAREALIGLGLLGLFGLMGAVGWWTQKRARSAQ
jgi:hypothetical protein